MEVALYLFVAALLIDSKAAGSADVFPASAPAQPPYFTSSEGTKVAPAGSALCVSHVCCILHPLGGAQPSHRTPVNE